MKLAVTELISKIDAYARDTLGIPTRDLVEKSGKAVADAVKEAVGPNSSVAILVGKGNNGADGYALALELMDSYRVTVYDVFAEGKTSKDGESFRESFLARGGNLVSFDPNSKMTESIKSSDCIVDAIFGTGFHGEMPEIMRPLAIAIRESVGARKIAVDVPLGINADDGSVSDFAISVGTTVQLSYIKPGIISYPARAYVGKIHYDTLGLPHKKIEKAFNFSYNMIDSEWVTDNLPKRSDNSHKGTFGKLLMITGSSKYRGAAHLALEAALRGGAGLVTFIGIKELVAELSLKFPEAIYKIAVDVSKINDGEISSVIEAAAGHSAILVGSGSDNTEGLLKLVTALLETEGAPIVLDADAINALASSGECGASVIRNARRQVILTPHPLEFSRLSGQEVSFVQQNRLKVAESFAKENGCILVLKGASTIVTDGKETYINTIGSSALAKAGSGDVLAGLLASLLAQGSATPIVAAALAVYYHSIAGDSLSEQLSSYGVTPSDLPREIARQIALTEKARSSGEE